MTDVIVVAILVVVLGCAIRYIYKAKKSGAKCIGCSAGGCKNGSSIGCGSCTGCHKE